jgi:hypothetical protein
VKQVFINLFSFKYLQILMCIIYCIRVNFLQCCCRTYLEQWKALKLYFIDMWVGERLLSAELLFKSSHDPFLKMYYEFMISIWIFKEEIAGITSFDSSTSTVDLPHLPLNHRKSRVGKATLAYSAGFVANSLLKKYGNCNMCGEVLLTSDGTAVPVEVIEARTYVHRISQKAWYLFMTGHFRGNVKGTLCDRSHLLQTKLASVT